MIWTEVGLQIVLFVKLKVNLFQEYSSTLRSRKNGVALIRRGEVGENYCKMN